MLADRGIWIAYAFARDLIDESKMRELLNVDADRDLRPDLAEIDAKARKVLGVRGTVSLGV